ncbi:MAG: hypothetical protein HQK96_12400 [Nitrospirae bacterium]|nr:hypothetical protein [Nitrospirota bacterium]
MRIILTPKHPQWSKFVWRLKSELHCCSCKVDGEMGIARSILESMDGMDVEGTISFFRQMGANCNAEICELIDEYSFFVRQEKEIDNYMLCGC